MGIAPYKYFTYDGKSSRDYDVYLTGEGVFNAPERAVEMLEIPGRNGNYALDQGKFNNISVTYKAGIVDVSESNFADKVSAVRNWLCSKVGYKRLSDDYNPNEYRMAVFKSGVNIDHVDLKTGEFEITFDCKPQRWLTSGETAVSVADGGTLDNPTPFEAEPLLAVDGYGTIGFNGYEVEIENVPIGDVSIPNDNGTLDLSALNTGDGFTISGAKSVITFDKTNNAKIYDCDYTSWSNCYVALHQVGLQSAIFTVTLDDYTFTKGTSASRVSTVDYWLEVNSTTTSGDATITLAYDGNSTITIFTSLSPILISNTTSTKTYSYPEIFGHSTKSAVADTVYIDCDIGECWTVQSGETISLNGIISLGSDLPKLASGTNTFNYDNTVTSLEVTPRWWKV